MSKITFRADDDLIDRLVDDLTDLGRLICDSKPIHSHVTDEGGDDGQNEVPHQQSRDDLRSGSERDVTDADTFDRTEKQDTESKTRDVNAPLYDRIEDDDGTEQGDLADSVGNERDHDEHQ
jgi:hypothetical protein